MNIQHQFVPLLPSIFAYFPTSLLKAINTDTAIVVVQKTEIELETAENQGDDVVRKAEVDEMQSFVGKKEAQRWLWHAIGHCTGEILAYALGSRHSGSVFETKEVASAFWNSEVLYRWFKNL